MTLANALSGGHGERVIIGGQSRHVVSYMKDFLFGPEQANPPVGVLSGGERGRLMLARALAQPANLLVLDEPTNDLDLETLDLLQEMLADYPGTVLVVSHDRDFLDRVATSTIASEGDGRWVEYAGGYSDMVAQRGYGVRAGAQPQEREKASGSRARQDNAAKPKRLSFKDKHALGELPGRISGATIELDLDGLLAIPRQLGYDVAYLIHQISRELGLTQRWAVAIVGIGNLGHALANYSGFSSRGFRTVALLDADDSRHGEIVAGLEIRGFDDLETVVREHGVGIGVIATPAVVAQSVVDRMVELGIRSILNFAPTILSVPEGIDVRRVDLSSELQILAYHEQRKTTAALRDDVGETA